MPTCQRCGRQYENPTPDIRNPKGSFNEIATDEWCDFCNRVAMSAVYRAQSVYFHKELPFGYPEDHQIGKVLNKGENTDGKPRRTKARHRNDNSRR